MRNKGIVFFDVDKTLIDWKEEILSPTEGSRQAIKNLKENGYLAFLATGRPKNAVAESIVSLNLDGYLYSNGACAEVNNKILYNECLDNNDLKEILEFLEANKISYFLEGQEQNYLCKSNFEISTPKLLTLIENAGLDKDAILKVWDINEIKVNKLIATPHDDNSVKIVKERFIEKGYAIMDETNKSGTFEIYNAKYTKGYGVKEVLRLLNIDKEKSYCFGDGENDLEMFQEVKYPIAMKGYYEKLALYAYDFTEDVINDGVEKGLKKLGLI